MPEIPTVIVPHSDYGDPECCGLIMAEVHGDQADLVCNECGAVFRTLPAEEAEKMLLEMSLEQGLASEMCPHCRHVNLFPGFQRMMAYTCRHCGKGVEVEANRT